MIFVDGTVTSERYIKVRDNGYTGQESVGFPSKAIRGPQTDFIFNRTSEF